MPLLLREELKGLLENPQDPSLSIFAPMVQAGPETRQNPVRIKNLLRQAEEKLIDLGMRGNEVSDFLAPARNLVKDASYWQQQATALVIFRNPTLFKAYRLPLDVEDLVVVGSTFHIKPLLPLLANDGRFFILAVSENEARLYSATRHNISEVHVEDMPKSLAEVLKFDIIEPRPQFHSIAAGETLTARPGAAPTRAGWLQGHGEPKDLAKEHIERYFRDIDRALRDVLQNERAPLVLAGVRYFLPIYQQVNSYPHLMNEIVEGNPERNRKSLLELHREAWKIVEPVFKKRQEESADLCRMAINRGKGSKDISEVLPAAFNSRVDRLFVPTGMQLWGSFNPSDGGVRINYTPAAATGEDDLLNLAAFQTYLKGGMVFAVNPNEMPVNSNVAAAYRF
jgi:hypothetical protein